MVLVVFAKREGHTERIARYLVAALEQRGCPARSINATEVFEPFEMYPYLGVIVCGSIRLGGVHEKEIVRFVKRHVRELETVSTAFLSVSLSEAGAENLDASAEDREVAAADAKRMINAFLANTEWRPNFAVPIAGALPYTKYNRFIRWLMKRMARSCGAPTDSSRDWVLTDWHVLDDLAERMAACGRCSSEALTGHPD